MSTIFVRALKLSPVFLCASLFLAGSSEAQESVSGVTAAVSTNPSVTTVEPTIKPFTELSQTPVLASNNDAVQVSEQPATEIAEPASESFVQLPQTQVEETATPLVKASTVSPNATDASSILAQQVQAEGNTTSDSTQVLEQIRRYSSENSGASSIDQVTNVS
ncbi:MAG TPA: hypothetical protein V6C91_23185, partial [Coleofasciculaceae cyanobacterium]